MMGMDPMMMGPDPIELFEEEIDNIVINPDPYETNPQYFAFPNQGAYEQYMIYGPKNIIGSMFGETLYGAPLGNDYIHGMGGPDNIYPDDFGNYIGVGSDIVYGGQGSDTIFAGGGDDYIYGDEGTGDSFSIYGNDDNLYGEAGNDFLFGGEGANNLWGGMGSDIFAIQKGVGEDVIFGQVNQGSATLATRIWDYNIYDNDFLFYVDSEYSDVSSQFTLGNSSPLSDFLNPLKVGYGMYTNYDVHNWATLYTEDFSGIEVLAHITTSSGLAPTITDADFVMYA